MTTARLDRGRAAAASFLLAALAVTTGWLLRAFSEQQIPEQQLNNLVACLAWLKTLHPTKQ